MIPFCYSMDMAICCFIICSSDFLLKGNRNRFFSKPNKNNNPIAQVIEDSKVINQRQMKFEHFKKKHLYLL